MYAGKFQNSTATRSILENFKQYGLSFPELIRADNHSYDLHFQDNSRYNVRNEDRVEEYRNTNNRHTPDSGCVGYGFYDVIISDPPYGIRAGEHVCILYVCIYVCTCVYVYILCMFIRITSLIFS